ncbi:MAG: hypothetical protein ACPIOQ_29345 [Promethearchaeia archaeon]
MRTSQPAAGEHVVVLGSASRTARGVAERKSVQTSTPRSCRPLGLVLRPAAGLRRGRVCVFGHVSSCLPSLGQRSDARLCLGGNVGCCSTDKADDKGSFSLHVADLSFRSRTPDLKEAFSSFGVITDCTVCRQPSGESRGFGFVTFGTQG